MNNEVASILEAIKIHAKETPDKLCAGDKEKISNLQRILGYDSKGSDIFEK